MQSNLKATLAEAKRARRQALDAARQARQQAKAERAAAKAQRMQQRPPPQQPQEPSPAPSEASDYNSDSDATSSSSAPTSQASTSQDQTNTHPSEDPTLTDTSYLRTPPPPTRRLDLESQVPSIAPIVNKLKNLWMNDPTQKFTIVSHGTNIETFKPIIAACSPVFLAMMESNMKEAAENRANINDFQPAVVQKMVEFCENGKIADFEGLEEDLYKIGHKYSIDDLMKLSLHQIIRTTTKANAFERMKMAMLYDLKELVIACSQQLSGGY